MMDPPLRPVVIVGLKVIPIFYYWVEFIWCHPSIIIWRWCHIKRLWVQMLLYVILESLTPTDILLALVLICITWSLCLLLWSNLFLRRHFLRRISTLLCPFAQCMALLIGQKLRWTARINLRRGMGDLELSHLVFTDTCRLIGRAKFLILCIGLRWMHWSSGFSM